MLLSSYLYFTIFSMGTLNASTVITLNNRCIKLMIGYLLNEKVYPFYCLEKPIPEGIITHGVIVNPIALKNEISKLSVIEDSKAKLKITILDVYLGIPPIGLQVFDCDKVTTTISDDGKINETDLKNLRHLILKDKPNPDTVFVDIVPDFFALDNGTTTTTSPIGMVSSTIRLKGKVFVLPKNVYESYTKLFEGTNIKLNKAMVITPSTVSFLSDFPKLPSSYILCDISEDITHLSFVGDNKLFSSFSFDWGGYNITKRIMETFECSYDEAENYKKIYGFDNRRLNFEPIIHTKKNEDGSEVKFYLSDLTKIIKEELDNFISCFNNAKPILLANQKEIYHNVPVLAIGGGSALTGLREYVESRLKQDMFVPINPINIGVRKPQYFNLLGLIKMAQSSKTGLMVSYTKEKGISREGK